MKKPSLYCCHYLLIHTVDALLGYAMHSKVMGTAAFAIFPLPSEKYCHSVPFDMLFLLDSG